MSREDGKFEAAVKFVVDELKNQPGREKDISALVDSAVNGVGWKYEGGLRLGIKALTAVGYLAPNYNGRRVKFPLNGQAPAPTPTPTPNPSTQDKATLDLIDAWKAKLTESDVKYKALQKLLEDAKNELAKKQINSGVLEVRIEEANKPTRIIKESFHTCFPKVLALAKARKNIFIYGPTGCGKSHLAHQVAKVLGLPFAFISCSAGMSEGKLEGRLLPLGEGGTFSYVISEFIKCYENGGVFLLDEIDAADPNVLLLVNAALANGRVAVPNRPENPYAQRHKDFICIAAANTVGTGADRMYSGRNKLDAATLDRFQIGKVMMDYDEGVEEQLCPDIDLRSRLQRYRTKLRANRLERAISSRFMKDAYEMKQVGWTMKDIEEALFTGWREDEVLKVRN